MHVLELRARFGWFQLALGVRGWLWGSVQKDGSNLHLASRVRAPSSLWGDNRSFLSKADDEGVAGSGEREEGQKQECRAQQVAKLGSRTVFQAFFLSIL